MNSTVDRQKELNEKIAVLLGGEIDKTTSRLWGHEPNPAGGFREWKSVPDYCNDLNAMHEAEKMLLVQSKINDQTTPFHRYFQCLHAICAGTDRYDEPMQAEHWAICATALQRAEAFVKTMEAK